MFKRVLVANRGEIAVRIIRTLRRLGIQSVVVASIPDRRSLATRLAGKMVLLEGYTPAETYLDQDAIVAAAKSTGCDAVHPGYGFLAENAEFADRCASEGIVFIGPTGDTLRRVGDKATARHIAVECGVPVVPGYDGPGDIATLTDEAQRVGFSLMIKARSGGGGRGMRVVRAADELSDALGSAAREAAAAFGDGSLLLERLIERAHHVEVQVIGDAHGNLIHLGERECSVQRRHQKLIEEAPSPIVDATLRRQLTDAAIRIAASIGYQNAGTFEFLVGEPVEGDTRAFWFIETNPRLQVEHPVTEEITGLDIVELQLRVAAGERLPLGQQDVSFNGHAIELRINAEDPASAFAPSTGRLIRIEPPTDAGGKARFRFDTGYESGDTVPGQYDSLLAKTIVWAPARDAAIEALVDAGVSAVSPLITNAALLRSVIAHDDFANGAVHVEWLEQQIDHLLERSRTPAATWAVAAATVWSSRRAAWIGAGQLALWLSDGNETRQVEQLRTSRHSMEIKLEGDAFTVALSPNGGGFIAECTGRRFSVTVLPDGRLHLTSDDGSPILFSGVPPPPLPREARPTVAGSTAVTAPLSGTVAAVYVAPGDQVEAGQLLLTLEAMKMEHRLVAPAAGQVVAVNAGPGATVSQGDMLVEVA